MKNINELSEYDLNCEMAIIDGYSEKWANKHSDLVPDYCRAKGKQFVIDEISKHEKL